MTIRQLKLPEDLLRLIDIAAETWNYPDHPEWSVQQDEEESMADSMKNYQKIWPFLRVIQFFSPGLRDFIHGHAWEEDGRIGGFTQIGRRGTTDTWYISAVGVHPDFRRRGIAQKLVETTIDFVREKGGKRLLLDVIEGNVPAINLYNKVGFINFTSNLQMDLQPKAPPNEPSLQRGYQLEGTGDYTWRPRYELNKRITPESITRFEPVEEKRYKRPFLTRLLFPLLKRAEGLKINRFIIYSPEGQEVAYAIYDNRTRETGRNTITVDLDPNHIRLAPFILNYILHQIFTANPDRVVELNLPIWQEALIEAAYAAGFQLRIKLLTMGYAL
jgi:ribosomal protein S18 acetylase RimI-like enzyme